MADESKTDNWMKRRRCALGHEFEPGSLYRDVIIKEEKILLNFCPTCAVATLNARFPLLPVDDVD